MFGRSFPFLFFVNKNYLFVFFFLLRGFKRASYFCHHGKRHRCCVVGHLQHLLIIIWVFCSCSFLLFWIQQPKMPFGSCFMTETPLKRNWSLSLWFVKEMRDKWRTSGAEKRNISRIQSEVMMPIHYMSSNGRWSFGCEVERGIFFVLPVRFICIFCLIQPLLMIFPIEVVLYSLHSETINNFWIIWKIAIPH